MFFSCFIGELRLIQEITSVISVVIAILLSLYIIRQTKRTAALIPSLSDFIQRGEDGETIMREDLALVIDAFGQRMAQGIKMSFLQGLGAQAKIEKGLKGAMAQDIIENKLPLLNLAGDILGFNTKQYIAKHPDALGQIIQLAAPLLQGGGLQGIMQPNQGNGEKGRFKY